jgi:hypothetical protein
MLRWVRAVLILAAVSFAAGAPGAARAAELIEWKDVAAVTGSGKPATAEEIRRAFLVGGARRGWTFTPDAPDKMTGRLVVRSHTLVMNLTYEDGKFSLTYQDSINLDYKDDAGKRTIHRAYVNWNTNLMNDARAELLRL